MDVARVHASPKAVDRADDFRDLIGDVTRPILQTPERKRPKLDDAFVQESPTSSVSAPSSQESTLSEVDFKDLLLDIIRSLECLIHSKSDEGRAELADLEVRSSSQNSEFNYSQTSACNVLLSSHGLFKFIESNLPGLPCEKSDLMSDPHFLLQSIRDAMVNHEKKSAPARQSLEKKILEHDRTVNEFHNTVDKVNAFLDTMQYVMDKYSELHQKLTYLVLLWYWEIPRVNMSCPHDYAWSKQSYSADASDIRIKLTTKTTDQINKLFSQLSRTAEKREFLNTEELSEIMHKFNLGASLRDLGEHAMRRHGEVMRMLRVLDGEKLDGTPLAERIADYPFADNAVMSALKHSEVEVTEVACSLMNHSLLPEMVKYVEKRIRANKVQCDVIYYSVSKAKMLLGQALGKMELRALKTDLASVEALTGSVQVMMEDADWMRDLCKYYIKQSVMMQCITPELAVVIKNFTKSEGALALNKAKLEQVLGWLDPIAAVLQQLIESESPVLDALETELFCSEDLTVEQITEPFFYLDCHPQALQSIMMHPHARELRGLLKKSSGAAIENPPSDRGQPASSDGSEDFDGFPKLYRDCSLIRSTPTLLPGI